MNIERKSCLYVKLARHLADEIKQGAYPRGKLPTEQSLKQQHEVSVVTVRKALFLLEEEGLVERRHGSGTYIYGWKKPKAGSRFKRTGLIDYIPCAGSEYVPGSFFNFLMEMVQRRSSESEYNCVMSPPDLYKAPLPVQKKRVDGILVAGNFYPHDIERHMPDYWQGVSDTIEKENDHYLHQLICSGLPVVAVANSSNHPDVHTVRADFDMGFSAAMQALKNRGHAHIVYTGGEEHWPEFRSRIQACRRQAHSHGMRCSMAVYPSHGNYEEETAVRAIVQALQQDDRPDAIIIGTGSFYKVEKACRQVGLCIPDDISVIMVSEAPAHAEWGKKWREYSGIKEETATVELPVPEFANLAMQRLLSLINGHEFSGSDRVVLVPLELHLGKTVSNRVT